MLLVDYPITVQVSFEPETKPSKMLRAHHIGLFGVPASPQLSVPVKKASQSLPYLFIAAVPPVVSASLSTHCIPLTPVLGLFDYHVADLVILNGRVQAS